jgi:hypothetical protein
MLHAGRTLKKSATPAPCPMGEGEQSSKPPSLILTTEGMMSLPHREPSQFFKIFLHRFFGKFTLFSSNSTSYYFLRRKAQNLGVGLVLFPGYGQLFYG